jgi:hypothetical protein
MTTPADRKIEETREHIRAAIKSISEIVIDETGGTQDLSDSFRADLRTSLDELLNIRTRIC